MIEESVLERPENLELPGDEIRGNNLRYSEDGLYFSIDGATFRLPTDEHCAAVGLGNSGKDELAGLVARLLNPVSGNLTIGETRMQDLPEAITGLRFGYVGPASFMFNGSVFDNLCYSLKHWPVRTGDEAEDRQLAHERHLSLLAGNTPDRHDEEWIDYAALGIEGREQLVASIVEILECVELDEEIYQFGLQSFVDQKSVDFTDRIMQARQQLRDRFTDPAVAKLVEPFDHEKYNLNMTVAENLLFGTVYDERINADSLIDNPSIAGILDETGLTDKFLQAGAKITEIMLDLFSDVEPDSELFEQFSFISAEDLPEFNQLLQQIRQDGTAKLGAAEKHRLVSLTFKLVVARHRLGLIDEPIQQSILEARARIFELGQDQDLGIEFFNFDDFNPRISIQDNILFGKLAYGQAFAQQKINSLIADVVQDLGLRKDIINAGLGYDVGVAGGRLSSSQRQKLGLARALLKAPQLLIVNEALSSLDTAAERRLIEKVRARMESRGILWILGRVQLAELFDVILVMERGRLADQGPYERIRSGSEHFQQLLESE